ncbi:flagellin lysine-N-methylase [Allofournierella massiliensis]|uniref:flagellin lysine-N-methylase n=1 Tax=Allofournierella massiliensis TaxID=1650663 RepID=UPI0039A19455
MRLTVPDYYDRFRCIASRCTDNCCIGWEIGIDPAALADYQSQPGAFGDRLRAAIQPGDPPFFALTKSGRCPFLNEENLCDIYRQLGESHLCAICDQHPRFHNWFGAEKESGLGLSCEEAARLILFSAPPRLLCRETLEAPDPDTELNPELLAGLRAMREAAFAILAEPSLPLAHRLALLAALGQDLQHWMDAAPQQAAAEGCTETRLVADAALALAEFYGDRTGWPGLIDRLTEAIPEADLSEFLVPLLELLESLPPNHAHWPERLAALRKALPHRLARPLWESPEQEQAAANAAHYMLYRYFLPAARQGDALCGPLHAIAAALLIPLLAGEDAAEPRAALIRAAKDYSREIEYAPDNLRAVDEAFWQADWAAPGLVIGGLLGLHS